MPEAAVDELLEESELDDAESFFDAPDDESELALLLDELVLEDLPRLSVL